MNDFKTDVLSQEAKNMQQFSGTFTLLNYLASKEIYGTVNGYSKCKTFRTVLIQT